MKYTLALFTLLFSLSAFAGDLTDTQEQNALEALDNICGDTWCEGDFDFSFNELNCDFSKESCELSFSFLEWAEAANGEWEVTREIPATCTITGITASTKLVERYTLPADDFYWKVGDCIDANYPEYY